MMMRLGVMSGRSMPDRRSLKAASCLSERKLSPFWRPAMRSRIWVSWFMSAFANAPWMFKDFRKRMTVVLVKDFRMIFFFVLDQFLLFRGRFSNLQVFEVFGVCVSDAYIFVERPVRDDHVHDGGPKRGYLFHGIQHQARVHDLVSHQNYLGPGVVHDGIHEGLDDFHPVFLRCYEGRDGVDFKLVVQYHGVEGVLVLVDKFLHHIHGVERLLNGSALVKPRCSPLLGELQETDFKRPFLGLHEMMLGWHIVGSDYPVFAVVDDDVFAHFDVQFPGALP